MRGVAVLLVMFAHAVEVPAVGGLVGVDIFFVLSGFLITTLLLEEHSATDRIGVLAFYRRRALRLGPALLVLLVVLAVAAPMGALVGLFFVMNLTRVLFHVGDGPLGHLWSLAVEEQFYLVWPLVLIVLLRFGRSWALRCLLLLTTITIVWRFAVSQVGSPDRVYLSTDTRVAALLVGCVFAFAFTDNVRIPAWIGYVAAGILIWTCATWGWLRAQMWGGGILAVEIATGLVILACMERNMLSRALGWRPLGYTGRRCYGLYLWHSPLFHVVGEVNHFSAIQTVVGFAISFLLAEASMRYVERPFLRRRRDEDDETEKASTRLSAVPTA